MKNAHYMFFKGKFNIFTGNTKPRLGIEWFKSSGFKYTRIDVYSLIFMYRTKYNVTGGI